MVLKKRDGLKEWKKWLPHFSYNFFDFCITVEHTHCVCTSKCNTTITTNYSGTIGFHYLFKTYFFQWFNAQKKLKCKSQKKFKKKNALWTV